MSSGAKIIEGLKDAVAGNFSSVYIEGQHWVRADWRTMNSAPRDGTEILRTSLDVMTVIKWPEYRECFEEGYWMPLPHPPVQER